LKLQNKNLP